MKHNTLRVCMSTGEQISGLCYLPVYFAVLPILLNLLYEAAGWQINEVSLNLGYFYVNFVAVMLLFHRFLAESLRDAGKHMGRFFIGLAAGAAVYLAGNLIVNLLLSALDPSLVNPADDTTDALVSADLRMMVVCAVFLGPVVEEALVRGLVFGGLHRHSRIAAYVVSCVLFAAMHLWQYAMSAPLPDLALSALEYLPAGLALGFAYEKSGNLWTPVVLHAGLNAMTVAILYINT